jgi:hypothetical protein
MEDMPVSNSYFAAPASAIPIFAAVILAAIAFPLGGMFTLPGEKSETEVQRLLGRWREVLEPDGVAFADRRGTTRRHNRLP